MKRIILITIIAVIGLFNLNTAIAQEKPLIIKGLYIGMDINDARNILIQLLGKEWKISPVGATNKLVDNYRFAGGDKEIFGSLPKDFGVVYPIIGDWGFAIQVNSSVESYHGYISADKEKNKVTRISLGGQLTDVIFSIKKVDAEDFVPAFWKKYNMPEFSWIPYGWTYTSPNGYTITIMTNKLIDIKKEDIAKLNKPEIKFD